MPSSSSYKRILKSYRLSCFIFVAVSFIARLATALEANALIGTWTGSVETIIVNTVRLRATKDYPLSLRITTNNSGQLEAFLSSPRWGEAEYPTYDVSNKDGELIVNFKGDRGSVGVLKGRVLGGEITGSYTWKGKQETLTLSKTDTNISAPQKQESQIPAPSTPYAKKIVSFKNGTLPITGTLTLPKGNHFPAVLFIAGGSPDTAAPELPGDLQIPYLNLVMADRLTRMGFAVLRTDARGFGGSGGDYDKSSISDLASDAYAAIEFLKSYPGVRKDHIGIIGHSLGSQVAVIAALKQPEIAFTVMLAGAAFPGDRVILDGARNSYVAPDAWFFARERLNKRLFQLAKDGEPSDVILKKLHDEFANDPDLDRGTRGLPYLTRLVAAYTSTMQVSVLRSDSQVFLRQFRVPLLAISGGRDRLVEPKSNLAGIEAALREANNPSFKIVLLPDANHYFSNDDDKDIRHPVDERLLEAVEQWPTLVAQTR